MAPTSSFVENYEFDKVAERPFYQQCPEWVVDHCSVDGAPATIVDLGCGSGRVIELLLERFRDLKALRIFAVDPSEPELRIARERVKDDRVEFREGRAQDLKRFVRDVDSVLMCNVIHQIPAYERLEVFQCVYEVLKPGGAFSFNTLYYDGDSLPDTALFYSAWMLRTFEELRRRGVEFAPPKGRGPAFERLTPEKHRELLVSAGFEEVSIEQPFIEWSVEDWETVCRYSVFIRNTLGDIDLDVGSAALQYGVSAAYKELGLSVVPRRVLHVVSRRPL